MLDFLRRHQKLFFIVITFVIVVSFCFFGTYSDTGFVQEDRVIGKALDGSKVHSRDIESMKRFLSTDRMDLAAFDKGRMPNLFQDGIIRHEMMEQDLGNELVKEYFEEVRNDLGDKVSKHKGFTSYVHPQVPFISAEGLWQQVAPAIASSLKAFKQKTGEVDQNTYDNLAKLYVEESRFPAYLLKQFLSYQQQQFGVRADESLSSAELSLFHATSFDEWFGDDMLSLMCQFIHNAAIYAKSQGIKVSKEEARADLLQHGFATLKAQSKDHEVTEKDLMTLWQNQLRSLGLSEAQAVEVWTKALLFRRLLEKQANSVVVDTLTFDQLAKTASETREIEVYTLPELMQVHDMRSLAKLELYLSAATKRSHTLSLPEAFLSVKEVMKHHPELVKKKVELEYKHVTLSELTQQISLKEMWNWQTRDENWSLLRKEFKELTAKEATDVPSRKALLDTLHDERRQAVDNFSRQKICVENGSRLDSALEQKQAEKLVLNIAASGSVRELPGVLDASEFLEFLESGSSLYTPDNKNYYQIHVMSKDDDFTVVTLSEALYSKEFDQVFDEHLEALYPELQNKYKKDFQKEDGSWRDFYTVKDLVAKRAYTSLCKAIEEDFVKRGHKLDFASLEGTASFYSQNRWANFMEKQRELATLDKPLTDTLFGAVQKSAMSVARKNLANFADRDVLAKQTGFFSSLLVANQNPMFYQCTGDVVVGEAEMSEQIRETQNRLAIESKKTLMKELVALVKDKQVIHLSAKS